MSPEYQIIETDLVETYYLNLYSIRKKYYNGEEIDKFYKELLLLTMEKKKEMEKLCKGDKDLMKAKDKLESLTEDSKFIGLYDKEKRDEIERKRREAYAKKIGYQEGVEVGFKDGITEQKIETAKKMLLKNMDIKDIEELTDLSFEEIEKIKESLN